MFSNQKSVDAVFISSLLKQEEHVLWKILHLGLRVVTLGIQRMDFCD